MEGDRVQVEEKLQEFDLEGQTASIIKAAEGTISEGDMDLLLKNLIATNFKLDEGIAFAEARHNIRGVVSEARRGVGKMAFLSNILNDNHMAKLSNLVYPAPSHKEHMYGSKNTLLRLMKNGNVFVVKMGDKTVAMQAVHRLDGEIDGRPVFELGKASTTPSFRRKGLTQRLAAQAFKEVMSDNPDAVWISMSRNEDLLAGLKEKGIHVYDVFDQTQEASRVMREFNGDYAKTLDHDGYKVIFLDPKVDNISFLISPQPN